MTDVPRNERDPEIRGGVSQPRLRDPLLQKAPVLNDLWSAWGAEPAGLRGIMVEGETFRMKFTMSRMTMWGFSIVSGRRIRARAMPESAEMALLHDRLGIGCRNCQAHRVLAQVAP